MANPSLKEILEGTRQLMAVKKAEFKGKTAAHLEGEGKDDSPKTRGHALDATQSALEPQKKPEITDEAMKAQPPADGKGTTAGGADGKDDSTMTRSHALDATQSALEPTKKPAISDENVLKTKPPSDGSGTAKVANEIVAAIREYQKAQKEAAAPKKDEKKPPEQKAEAAATVGTEAPVEKPASVPGLNMELTTDVLAKIAAMVLAEEEGAAMVERVLAKAAGAEKAEEVLAYVAAQSEAAEKQAAYDQGVVDAQKLIDQLNFERGVKAAEYDQGKQAANQMIDQFLMQKGGEEAIAKLRENPSFFAKLGQAMAEQGVDPAALMGQGAGAMGPEGAGADVSPEDLQGITMEDVQAALESLVQEGKIQPQEAEQVLQMLASEMGGGEAGAAGAEAAPAPAGEAAAAGAGEADGGGEEQKEAAARAAVTPLLQAIRALRK